MFRIRRIHDDVLPVDRDAIAQVQAIVAQQFDQMRKDQIAAIPEHLRNPRLLNLRTTLHVAERRPGSLIGCAISMHDEELRFSWLDVICTARGAMGGGLGGGLYQRVREEALALGSRFLFFEVGPDDLEHCPEPELRRVNARRVRFYEAFGARVIAGTDYQAPVHPGDEHPPLLMVDALDQGGPLLRDLARAGVRAILERRYAYLCPPDYVERVVRSFLDDPVQLRPRLGPPRKAAPVAVAGRRLDGRVALVVATHHELHHVRERGYVEAPARIDSILLALEGNPLFRQLVRRHYPERHLHAVHDAGFLSYLRRVCSSVPKGKSVYPYVFPIRNASRPPKDLAVQAGYYCIDTFTPLNGNAYQAAREAVDCTLRAADALLEGYRLAYALVRPPGHHAERRVFGGFCYFNNNAIAAHYLSAVGRVAILDLDFHHGNGQQEIFYRRDDVLTISLHGDPSFAYPYFSGFATERGEGPGVGFNVNYPLPESLDGPQYRRILGRALRKVVAFRPRFLVVALGLDTARRDPTGTWSLVARDFTENGRMVGVLGVPTLVVQEGGYQTRTLGLNACSFLEGLASTSPG